VFSFILICKIYLLTCVSVELFYWFLSSAFSGNVLSSVSGLHIELVFS